MKIKPLEMSINFKYTLLFCLLLPLTAFTQNLIYNPSFEELRDLPVKPNPRNSYEYEPLSGYKPFQRNLNFWFAGSKTTPDLRITSEDIYRKCAKRFDDCDKARTGINSIGLITYMKNVTYTTYREYAAIKLKSALKPNVKTFIEFWIRKERQAKLTSNNIGCYFSKKKVYADIVETIDVKPHFNYDTIINESKSEWIKIEGSFIPEKEFAFMTIGNFFKNEETKVSKYKDYSGSGYTPPYAYYLIDDIRGWQEGQKEEVENEDSKTKEPIVFEGTKVIINKPVQLNNIEFAYDSAELEPQSFSELEKLISFLQSYSNKNILIHGHTDDKGNDDYNLKLSKARAKAVLEFLINRGIDQARLSFDGFGETRPLVFKSDDLSRRKNRRVEFLIVDE